MATEDLTRRCRCRRLQRIIGARSEWVYVKRPTGRVTSEHYELREDELSDDLSTNEVLIRARYISVDPYMRIQQAERNSFDVPHPLGIVQRAGVVGQV